MAMVTPHFKAINLVPNYVEQIHGDGFLDLFDLNRNKTAARIRIDREPNYRVR